jgi:hypothetical protein
MAGRMQKLQQDFSLYELEADGALQLCCVFVSITSQCMLRDLEESGL